MPYLQFRLVVHPKVFRLLRLRNILSVDAKLLGVYDYSLGFRSGISDDCLLGHTNDSTLELVLLTRTLTLTSQ